MICLYRANIYGVDWREWQLVGRFSTFKQALEHARQSSRGFRYRFAEEK